MRGYGDERARGIGREQNVRERIVGGGCAM